MHRKHSQVQQITPGLVSLDYHGHDKATVKQGKAYKVKKSPISIPRVTVSGNVDADFALWKRSHTAPTVEQRANHVAERQIANAIIACEGSVHAHCDFGMLQQSANDCLQTEKVTEIFYLSDLSTHRSFVGRHPVKTKLGRSA